MELSKTYVPFFFEPSAILDFLPLVLISVTLVPSAGSLTIISMVQAKRKKAGEGQRVIGHANVFPFISGNPALYKECCPANFHFYFLGQENGLGDTGSASQ